MMMTTQSRHRAHAQMIQHKKFLQKKPNQFSFWEKKNGKNIFQQNFSLLSLAMQVFCVCVCVPPYILSIKRMGGDTMMMMRCGRPFVVFATV
jgi:hypothetical protein